MWFRSKLEDCIRTLMNGTESDVHEFIESSRIEFSKLPIEEVSFPRGVSDIKKIYNIFEIMELSSFPNSHHKLYVRINMKELKILTSNYMQRIIVK